MKNTSQVESGGRSGEGPLRQKKDFMAKAIAAPDHERSAERSIERSAAKSGGNGNQVSSLITRTTQFLKDVRSEMRKVVTPAWAEVQSTTIVVLVTVFAFAAFFYVCDSVLDRALRVLLHWLGTL
jgi:preprotein translocase subunit SecE